MVAWLDDDKLHRALGLAAGTPRTMKLSAIRRLTPPPLEQRPGAVAVHLVDGNIETFLKSVDAARPGALSAATLKDALAKDRTARDLCFAQAAVRQHADWRAELRRRNAGFDCVVRYLACLAVHEPWPPW